MTDVIHFTTFTSRPHMTSSPGSLVLLAIAAIALTSCGTGQDRTTATAKASATVPLDVEKSKIELDHVLVALTGIRDASDTADLKKMYNELNTHTKKLEEFLSDVQSSSDSALEAGKAQVVEWHKQNDTFTDVDLRSASNKRESELRQTVDAFAASSARLKIDSDAYKASLDQTLHALDLDLSQPGVQSIKPVVAKIISDEPKLRNSLTDVSEKSNAVNAFITHK